MKFTYLALLIARAVQLQRVKMAEAMVKEPSMKEHPKSAAPTGQKGKERKGLPSPAVAWTSKGILQKTGNFGSTPAPTPPLSKAVVNFNSEAIAILREMNSNQNKANANFAKLS